MYIFCDLCDQTMPFQKSVVIWSLVTADIAHLSIQATMDILKDLGITKARLKKIKIKHGRISSGEIQGYIESDNRTFFGRFQWNAEICEVRPPYENAIICALCIFAVMITAAIYYFVCK